jgi:predicted dinucleotide-utilizing enzyme
VTLSVGPVGCGDIGRTYATNLREAERADLVVVYDRDGLRALEVSHEIPRG